MTISSTSLFPFIGFCRSDIQNPSNWNETQRGNSAEPLKRLLVWSRSPAESKRYPSSTNRPIQLVQDLSLIEVILLPGQENTGNCESTTAMLYEDDSSNFLTQIERETQSMGSKFHERYVKNQHLFRLRTRITVARPRRSEPHEICSLFTTKRNGPKTPFYIVLK